MILSAMDQDLVDLLNSQLDGMVAEFEEIATANDLPTSEYDILTMIETLVARRLDEK